ncbi:Slp family lipoprotein [Pasteurellaceae bacterium 22721_9_1]
MIRKICAIFTALLLASCVNPPAGLEKDEFTITRLSQIKADDYSCHCKQVRLGGKVLSATALKKQTKLEILSLSVSSLSAKPILDSQSDGRFIAYVEGFIDPEQVKNQYVTIKGVLASQEKGKIDLADYVYPVINATAFKQWRLVQEYYYDRDDWEDWYEDRFGFPGWRIGGFWHMEPKLRYVLY